MARHNEWAFESAVEAHLLANGWLKGVTETFHRELAVDAGQVAAFISETQPDLWAEFQKQQGKSLENTLLDWLVKALNDQGTLHVLRHGFKFYGKLVRLAYFKPSHGMNPELLEKYGKNCLVVTRQLKMDPKSEKSVDMVLLLNGLPIVTVELKNPLTNQNVNHSIQQYRDRDPTLPLFQFKKRALVHFAVDPDVAYMSTKLDGKNTNFLPFNKGSANGAGNPPTVSGHRTAYLWEEVWQRDSFLDIIGRFMHLTSEEKQVAGKVVTKETVIFPRYHQLDAVRKMEAAAREEGPGSSYLVQHSAGSGKSNSIAWLAYRLSELHKDDKKVFHSVIVVTDRRVLDKQLQDTIYQFEHKQGVVARIDEHSSQLAEALSKGTPIVITTLQKFPYVAKQIGGLPDRAYALVLDEAHSSQGGEASAKMKEVLSAKNLEEAELVDAANVEEEDAEDVLQKVMASRGKQKNLSFFAFTATPKAKTLEVFGRKGADGKPRPFHLYSMRQAIQENFILDVLKNYTTYKTYWKLLKKGSEDPMLPKRETAAILARFVSLHPHNVAQKTEIMVEHFRHSVKHKIGGRAKAMVVTASRLHAVRYRQAFDKYLAEKGYKDIGVLVAFSGEVADPDVPNTTYTEPKMNNGKSEKALPAEFAKDEFHLLVVANKYQTGFDQPLLHTMYVDKRLSGVAAVQTLSRLNRMCGGKEETFVLDFVNDGDDIRAAFQPYYQETTVAESADPKRLYELYGTLEEAQVYWKSEVEAFCAIFYKPKAQQNAKDHGELYKHLYPGVDRFKALDEDAQDEFRTAMDAFVSLYSFLSQVIPFKDSDLEKLYTFGRFFLLKLPPDPKKAPLDIDSDVVLSHYHIERTAAGALDLEDAGGEVYGITEAGTKKGKPDLVKLSEVIDVLNERFGTEFSKADQLFFDSVIEQAKANDVVKTQAQANTLENFSLAMKATVQNAIIDRMGQNEQIATRYLNDDKFGDVAFKEMVRRIYQELRTQGP
jgi:type I restriction enzyme R subunit